MPELLKGRKKPTVAGKKRIQIMLNLTKAKLSCLPSFTKHSTVKKLSYERENFTSAYHQVQEPNRQHNQPP